MDSKLGGGPTLSSRSALDRNLKDQPEMYLMASAWSKLGGRVIGRVRSCTCSHVSSSSTARSESWFLPRLRDQPGGTLHMGVAASDEQAGR